MDNLNRSQESSDEVSRSAAFAAKSANAIKPFLAMCTMWVQCSESYSVPSGSRFCRMKLPCPNHTAVSKFNALYFWQMLGFRLRTISLRSAVLFSIPTAFSFVHFSYSSKQCPCAQYLGCKHIIRRHKFSCWASSLPCSCLSKPYITRGTQR